MFNVELESFDEFIEEDQTAFGDASWLQQPKVSVSGKSSGRRARGSSAEAKCRVCHLAASGNNFGVATCESCKTFFRRNAKRDSSQIRCLHQGNCNITEEYRRSCTACRLEKCFAVGMRKELILSEEKLRARAKPTFKKPRYRWCRVPTNVDVEKLLALLPHQQRQEQQHLGIKQERMEPLTRTTSFTSQASDLFSQPVSPLTEFDLSVVSTSDFATRTLLDDFESSDIYNKLCMCVTNYQLPYEASCAPTLTSKLFSLEDGFTMMENSIRKMIRLIPEMPHFDELDKPLLGKLVKFKVFGGIHVIGGLSYDFAREAWVALLQTGQGMEETVINTREAVLGAFMDLTTRSWIGGRPLYTVKDVEQLYECLVGCFSDVRRLFGEQRKVASVILLGIYLLEQDVGLDLTEEERRQLDRIQSSYFRYLDGLVGAMEHPVEFVCRKAMLVLARIRSLDMRIRSASRLAHVEQLPPLMQELVGR